MSVDLPRPHLGLCVGSAKANIDAAAQAARKAAEAAARISVLFQSFELFSWLGEESGAFLRGKQATSKLLNGR